MLTQAQNERLTRVGRGTPGGELLRRYWQPLCGAQALSDAKPKKRIRILGEDLVVFRDGTGGYACVAEKCPHRNASLYFGFIEPDGIRCCYHGWKYDCTTGACIERPFETAAPSAGTRVQTYPVKELGGLLFAYMGPDPAKAPLLPNWDVMVRADQPRKIVVLPLHRCNWLQCQENTADSVHTYYLHGHTSEVGTFVRGAAYYHRPIVNYDYAVCEWGVEKTIEYGGDRPEKEIRPPVIFPNILRIPQGPIEAIHWRVPVDDENTRIIWAGLLPRPEDAMMLPPDAEELAAPDRSYVDNYDLPHVPIEQETLTDFPAQDRVVWETQGRIADRSHETLGASDRGIVLFRRMLAEQIDRVERGEEPNVAVMRDAEQNRIIEFPSATIPTINLSVSTA